MDVLEATRLITTGQTIAEDRVDRSWHRGWNPPAVLLRRDGGPVPREDNRMDTARIVFESYGTSEGEAYYLSMQLRALMLPEITEGYVGQAGDVYITDVSQDAAPAYTPTEDRTDMYRSSYLVTYSLMQTA